MRTASTTRTQCKASRCSCAPMALVWLSYGSPPEGPAPPDALQLYGADNTAPGCWTQDQESPLQASPIPPSPGSRTGSSSRHRSARVLVPPADAVVRPIRTSWRLQRARVGAGASGQAGGKLNPDGSGPRQSPGGLSPLVGRVRRWDRVPTLNFPRLSRILVTPLAVATAATAVAASTASAWTRVSIGLDAQTGVLSITGTETNDIVSVFKQPSANTPGGYVLSVAVLNSDPPQSPDNCITYHPNNWLVSCPALNVTKITFDGKLGG